jgi:hypothetical protein
MMSRLVAVIYIHYYSRSCVKLANIPLLVKNDGKGTRVKMSLDYFSYFIQENNKRGQDYIN